MTAAPELLLVTMVSQRKRAIFTMRFFFLQVTKTLSVRENDNEAVPDPETMNG